MQYWKRVLLCSFISFSASSTYLSACSVNETPIADASTDASTDLGKAESGGNDASDAGGDVAEAGCTPCVVGVSFVGNCCVQ